MSTKVESLLDAPIIHAFSLAQKRFFQPVNSQKPRAELGTCVPFSHVPHSDNNVPFVASKGMDRLSNGQNKL